MKIILKISLVLAVISGPLSLAKSSIGLVSSVRGKATHQSENKTAQVEEGAMFFVGDVFELESGARVFLKFHNGNTITLKSKTKFRVKNYPSKKKPNSPSTFDLIYGTLRALVTQKTNEVEFTVLTPSSVSGVRGTDFLVSYDPTLKESRCVTFSGVVEFSNLDKNGRVAKTVRLTAGQISTIVDKSGPTQVKPMPKKKLERLKKGVEIKVSPKIKKAGAAPSLKKGANSPGSLGETPQRPRQPGDRVRDAERTRDRIRERAKRRIPEPEGNTPPHGDHLKPKPPSAPAD